MNGNRSRYSTNPTFSMQKKGFFNKRNAPMPAEKPDFTSMPEPSAPPQTLFTQPVQQQPMAGPSYPPVSELFSGVVNTQNPMSMPSTLGFGQPPVSAPMQPQQSPLFPMQSNPTPFSFGAQPTNNLPPLGAQPNLNSGFSPRSQGFTPPPAQPQPSMFGNPAPIQPMQTQAPAAPTVQPAGFGNASPFMAAGMQQPQAGYASNPFSMQPPMNQSQPPAGYGPVNSQSMDADTLWKLFLFLLLPVLFIPCLFVPANMNVLRYVFLALCAAGIGILWTRKMFTPNNRIIVTLGYVAACVAILVMLFSGSGQDLQNSQTSDPSQQPSSQQFVGGLTGEMSPEPSMSPTPEPTPTVAPVSEAQLRLEAFMTNWSAGKIEDMVRLVQPSWASAQDNPSNRLFVLLGNRTPLAFNIEEISGSDNDSSRTVSMTANIDKNNGKDPILYRFMVLMVKEGGDWYVDPNSLATNDQVTISEETAVVNDSQSTAAENWEIAPRQTVTPAPPGSQLLYFNPDGGSMYHMDQNCPSIYDEFLPLQGSFPYSELGDHRDLLPCLKCGAPTQTLPPADTGDGTAQ